MGDIISGLTNMEATVPAADDKLVIVDKSDTSQAATGTTKRWEWLDFLRELFATRFGADAGASDTYVVTLTPAPAAYVTGEHYRFKANTANTGACTINFNGLGAKTIKKAAGGITTDLADNDIRAGQWVDLVYDGTNMQMQSTLGNTVTSAAPSGSAGGDLSGTYPNPTVASVANATVDGTNPVGFRNIPQSSSSANTTTVLSDAGGHLYHPASDNNPRTFTIDSNANVAYPIGTAITFINDKNTLTIAITADTLVWAEDGSTGSRTLAENGMATAVKVTSTRWIISGTGLS